MFNYSICVATEDDLESIRKLMIDDHTVTTTYSDDKLILSRIQSGDIHVAKFNDLVVGIIRIDRIFPDAIPLVAWAAVEPNHRRHGIFTQLTATVEKIFKEAGYKYILYSALSTRPFMMNYFQKHSMIKSGMICFPTGQIEHFYWKPI